MMDKVLERLEADKDVAMQRYFDALRIPSISTDPDFDADVRNMAEWFCADLQSMGFTARVAPTGKHPMVVAHFVPKGAHNATPHVLFYGHYDVQPPDPLQLWETGPFDPFLRTLEDGNQHIVARGASDDKGQVLIFFEACRAWLRETGCLPLKVSVLLEGEEESGSESMRPFLLANADELRADLVLVCDTNMVDRHTPAIAIGLRGMVYEQVRLKTMLRDAHSGMVGGLAHNPIHLLTDILAQMRNETGQVMLSGFYEGVPDIDDAKKAQWARLKHLETGLLDSLGVPEGLGEIGFTGLERIWARPTLEINGIEGGYTGPGAKTVIPAVAMAKISCRLVGTQDPVKIRTSLHEFIKSRCPDHVDVSFTNLGATPAVHLPVEAPYLNAAKQALKDEWGQEAVLIGFGGTIPVITDFHELLGLDSLMIGFAHDDDCVHAPNEKYDMRSFEKGARSWARILGRLASALKGA